ncbi:uncharacterized protein EI90DRAFT_3034023 [Cantharellus anzutake]|uniref:uncharacterized protein n=1 Tax=Cantharellus anzutake TaxID=1750568 RepID=UPI001905FC46|nr:uncharacterized protein EI90DRAFT_3034023 [Cantharellus anzutake]KAF8341461.1 hypothetical protein EI90DRAFT_3034023 [Cantharellus anzutake]
MGHHRIDSYTVRARADQTGTGTKGRSIRAHTHTSIYLRTYERKKFNKHCKTALFFFLVYNTDGGFNATLFDLDTSSDLHFRIATPPPPPPLQSGRVADCCK